MVLTQNNSEGGEKVYFARHKYKYKTGNVKPLFNEHRIGIHYKDSKSTRPEDYSKINGKVNKTAESTMGRYNEIRKKGAIVGAVYEGNDRKIFVGKVRPGTGNKCISVKGNGKGIFKTARLANCKIVTFAECPVLWAIMPRQSTLVEWKKGAKILRAIMRGKKMLKREVESLDIGQLEVLCYNYMVKNHYISSLLLPIGRTLRDVDIYGMDKRGQLVMAQVTQSRNKAEIDEKEKGLSEAAKGKSVRLFLFARTHSREKTAVKFINIENVFNELDKDTSYHDIISRMLKIEFNDG